MSRKLTSLWHEGVTFAFRTKSVNKSFDAASIRRDERNQWPVFRHKKRVAFPKLKPLGTRPVDRNLLGLFYPRMISTAMTNSRNHRLRVSFWDARFSLRGKLRLDLQAHAQHAASADADIPFANL